MGYTQLAIVVGKILICPFDLWVPYFQTNPLCGLGFSGAMFHAIPRCYWMFLAESTYDFPTVSVALPHPAQSKRRRLGHVTYLPDHQRQRVLDGIYDSWIQPGSWIPGGLLNGRGTQGDTSLACPPWPKEDEGVGVAPWPGGFVGSGRETPGPWRAVPVSAGDNYDNQDELFKMNFHLVSWPLAFCVLFQPSNFRAVLWPGFKDAPRGLEISRAVWGYEMFDHVIYVQCYHGAMRYPTWSPRRYAPLQTWSPKRSRAAWSDVGLAKCRVCPWQFHVESEFQKCNFNMSPIILQDLKTLICSHTVRVSITPQRFSLYPNSKASIFRLVAAVALQVCRIIISWIGGRNRTRSFWVPWRPVSAHEAKS